MNLKEIIANRRAIYPDQYIDKPIAKADLLEILEAGNWAPTHKKTEPWRFKIMQGESLNSLSDFLAETYEEITPPNKFSSFKKKKVAMKPKQSGAVIAICMQRDLKESLPEWEEIASVAMAVQNMWLMASSLGLGAYWSSPGLISEMHKFFELKEGEKCLGFFYLGHYEGDLPEGKKGDINEKITWI